MVRNQAATAWTTEQLVHMSQSLARAYGTTLEQTIRHRHAPWTSQQLLNLSTAMSFPIH